MPLGRFFLPPGELRDVRSLPEKHTRTAQQEEFAGILRTPRDGGHLDALCVSKQLASESRDCWSSLPSARVASFDRGGGGDFRYIIVGARAGNLVLC